MRASYIQPRRTCLSYHLPPHEPWMSRYPEHLSIMPTMSGQVPHEVFGLAVFVHVLGFVAVFLGLVLCFMLWRHGEGLSYILLLGVSTTLGAVQGVITHLDYTINWRQIQIGRYEASQRPQYDQTAMFGKADSGWRSVLAGIAIYLYNVDSLLVLFWAITLFIGTWNIRIKSERKRIMAIVFKSIALVLPAVMVSVCQIQGLRKHPMLFLVTVNIIMTFSMVVGFVLVLAILYKYLLARSLFKRLFKRAGSTNGGPSSLGTVSSATTTTRSGHRGRTTDKWLIIRFSLIMAVLIAFEAALIVYELVNFQRSHDAQRLSTAPSNPEFSIEQARVDLLQYIPGVVPSIVAWCIFGTTAAFRKEYMAFMRAWCCCLCLPPRHPDSLWRRRSYGRQSTLDVEAPYRQVSLTKGSKRSISIEVNTEISLSSITNHKIQPVNNINRVSFGGTSLFSDSNSRRNLASADSLPSSSPRFPLRTLAYGTSPRASGLRLPKGSTRYQSFTRSTCSASSAKALPELPLQVPRVSCPASSHPNLGVEASRSDPNNISPPLSSWLSTNMDSKTSSIYSGSEYTPTRMSATELFPLPLAVRSSERSTAL